MMKAIHILLVEDNEGDILLTKEAFEDSRIINRITVKKDGNEAIKFFADIGNKDDLPDIVLLDINLPKKNGHEVLNFIKTHEDFKQVPVIMLTTSASEKDILVAYKSYVNCFITKPIDVDDFMKAVVKIEDFWINIVSIPKK